MDKQTFRRAAGLSEELASRWFDLLVATTDEFGISTPQRQAAFIAQIRHESGGFRYLSESFNYKPSALAIFSRVPVHERGKLGRQQSEAEVPLVRQQQIANLAYGGRYGNGDPASGDGWRYRGRGLKQITFRDNYAACGKALGLDLVAEPDLLATVDKLAVRSAGWFWKTNGCNGPADRDDFAATTRIINGPAMDGQEKRVAFWNAARSALQLA
ncbi:glycoside hydrolase family 19 protein [Paraburkholderia sp. BCC1884]|uniref:glycoside hydrolase family 19 protein n=1 Tax=Paraburkholderia sp. BCC1884 TaxID=2562668 RepID=UPI001184159E|nr:glycoside hydrolase family 19 protein [Paraburkholderia sp. BCC1884]